MFGAQHWNGTGWDAPVGGTNGVTSGTGTVTVSAVNTFTPWILSSKLVPLPIELISFTAECDNNKTKLNWSTASKKNNNYFTLEKSNDGVNFNPIAEIEGHGNSTQTMYYTYTDNSGNNATTYYRLKQTDYNGKFDYSSIITLEETCIEKDGFNTIAVYPNPNSERSLYLNYTTEKDETATIKLTTVLGQTSMIKAIDLHKGSNVEGVSINDVALGIYFLEIESTQLKTPAVKFIKE